MKYLFIALFFFLILCTAFGQNNIVKTAGVSYTAGAPTFTPGRTGSQVAIDTVTGFWYEHNGTSWSASGYRVQTISGCAAPAYTPAKYQSRLVINACTAGQGGPELYYYTGSDWLQINKGQTYTEGASIDITGGVITNTAPDQTVSLTGGAGISTTGTYPNFTISGTAAGLSKWTDGGAYTYLTTTTDRALVGSSTEINSSYILQANGNFSVKGSSASYSDNLAYGQNSAGSSVFQVTNDGRFYIGSKNGYNEVLSVDRSGANTTGDLIGVHGNGKRLSINVDASNGAIYTDAAAYSMGASSFGGAFYLSPTNNYVFTIVGTNTGIGVLSTSALPSRLYVKGGGATSSTWTAQFQNSGGANNALMVRDDSFISVNNASPLSQFDILGAAGYSQLRIRTSYTPTSTADALGSIGDTAWDANYFYIKTAAGWKRTALSTF